MRNNKAKGASQCFDQNDLIAGQERKQQQKKKQQTGTARVINAPRRESDRR
jgi:hypothetical protein